MQEVSIIEQLQQQKEKNEGAYKALFGSLNLSSISNFQSLPHTNLTEHQALVNAGFQPESLIDRLTERELKLLAHLAKLDISRIYLEEDLKRVADRYGLKMLRVYEYKGCHQSKFAGELNDFQQALQTATIDKYFDASSLKYKYRLLGSMASIYGYQEANRKVPLILLHVGEDIYYLVTSYDCWIPWIRSLIFLPFANPSKAIPIALSIYILWIILTPLILNLCAYVIISLYLLAGLIHFNWTMPTPLPGWLGKFIYRILP